MGEPKKRHFPFIKILILLILAGLFVIIGLNVSQKEAEAETEYKAPVVTVRPARGRLEKVLRIDGFVSSEEMVTVSPRVSGIVLSLEVGMGDFVEEGELIVRMDEEPLHLAFLQAEAAYLSTESTFQRLESLYDNKAATRQSFDEARAGYEAAKSAFELAQLNLEYARVLAPLSGAVLETHINRGALAGPGVPLVTLGDLDALIVEIKVPEHHYSFFIEEKDEMQAYMEVPALNGRQIPIRITAVASHITPETRSFTVKCEIEAKESTPLRPGMFVKAFFIVDARDDALYLPFQTVSEGGRLWYVDGEGRSASTAYEPEFLNDRFFTLTDEYSEYRFILEGQHFLLPGREVNIIEEREADSK